MGSASVHSASSSALTTKKSSSMCSFSMVHVVAAFVICQLLLACSLVWYLGYRTTLANASALSEKLRAGAMHEIVTTLSYSITEPVAASNDLKQATLQRWPDFADRVSISGDPEFLVDLSYFAARYPDITHMGIVNKRSIFVAFAKSTPQSTSAPHRLLSVAIAEPLFTNVTGSVDLNLFVPRPIHLSSCAPDSLIPDVLPSDNATAVARYLGPPISIIPQVVPTSFPQWVAGVNAAARGSIGGWTEPFPIPGLPGSDGFVALSAVSIQTDAWNDQLSMIAFAVVSMEVLHQHLRTLDIGAHGQAYVVRSDGHIIASSDASLQSMITEVSAPYDIDMATSSDEWVQRLVPFLQAWNLITPTCNNNASSLSYNGNMFSQSLTVSRTSYHIQAQMLNPTTNLALTLVLITRDDDYEGEIAANIVTTVWLTIVVCVGAIIASLVVTRWLTRPLLGIVSSMNEVVTVMDMEHGLKRKIAFLKLYNDWTMTSEATQGSSTPTIGLRSIVSREPPAHKPNSLAATHASERPRKCAQCIGGNSMREVRLMHRAFESVLYSLSRYDELDAINRAKQQFIRFIFHEVRVPFNAIVLGIDQLCEQQSEPHGLSPPLQRTLAPNAIDTIDILREQCQFVTRILNGVLCMQQIEDGALKLEVHNTSNKYYSCFLLHSLS
jgi:signal transduction histidine kinase